MKEIRELDRATLTTEQKLGLLLCANLNHGDRDVDDAVEMIRDHRLGSVWVPYTNKKRDEIIARVREAADYPILILCDAENGYPGDAGNGHPGYTIPAAVALSAANARDEYAYAFGRVTASCHAALGYNVICNPLLDRVTHNTPCGGITRTLGPDKEIVAHLGEAICRGMHDGGVLTVAKHYPSGQKKKPYDSHMREGYGEDTREDLVSDALYPYRKLIEKDLIDGVMVGHGLYPNIDPDRPASLSRPVLDILREDCGFGGFYISDALNMMGVVLKYGNYKTTPMAVEAGCDVPLSWGIPCREAYKTLLDGYRDGTITDEQLEISVGRVLEAQHRVTLLPQNVAVRPEDVENIRRLNCECISAVCEEGLTPAISREGKHLFVLMTDGTVSLEDEYEAFANKWYNPVAISERIRELFPQSGVMTHPEYPTYQQNMAFFKKQQEYDDIVYVTYYSPMCFIGRECLTARTVDMMDALQSTERIVAHLHFGNPFVATDAPYVPRVLLGWTSAACVEHTLKILAGEAECLGTQPYAKYLHFHKKGDVLV